MKVYNTEGVCSSSIQYQVTDGQVCDVNFIGGCNGNLQGIASLVEGMKIEEVIDRLADINCSGRGTSCPDQLSKALRTHL